MFSTEQVNFQRSSVLISNYAAMRKPIALQDQLIERFTNIPTRKFSGDLMNVILISDYGNLLFDLNFLVGLTSTGSFPLDKYGVYLPKQIPSLPGFEPSLPVTEASHCEQAEDDNSGTYAC